MVKQRLKRSFSFLLVLLCLVTFTANPVLAANSISTHGIIQPYSAINDLNMTVDSTTTYTVTLSSTRVSGSGNLYVSFYNTNGSQTIFTQKVLNNTTLQQRFNLSPGTWKLLLSTDSSEFIYVVNIHKTF